MKKLLTLFFAVTTSFCYSQSNEKKDIAKFQAEWTNKAEENIKERQLGKAYIAYNFVRTADSLTKMGKVASIKADSIKAIVRNKLKSQIIGRWELKKTGSNWGFSDIDKDKKRENILVISDDSLSFYETTEMTTNTINVKTEKIKFIEKKGMYSSYNELVFSDNQIWSFRLENDGEVLHLTNTGEVAANNSRTEIVCGNLELIYERIK